MYHIKYHCILSLLVVLCLTIVLSACNSERYLEQNNSQISKITDDYQNLNRLELPNGDSIELDKLLKYDIEECKEYGITTEMLESFIKELEIQKVSQQSVQAVKELVEQLKSNESNEMNKNYGIQTTKGMIELDTLLEWKWEDYQNAEITSQQVDDLILQLQQDNQSQDYIAKLNEISAELKEGKTIQGGTDNYINLYELEFPNGSSVELDVLLKYSLEECKQYGITTEMLESFIKELEIQKAPQQSVQAVKELVEQLKSNESNEMNKNYGIQTTKGMIELDTLLEWKWEDYQNAEITSQQVDDLILQLQQDNQSQDYIAKLNEISAELKEGKTIQGGTDNYINLYELEFPNGSSVELDVLLKYSLEECKQYGITTEMLESFIKELEIKKAPQQSIEAVKQLAEQLR